MKRTEKTDIIIYTDGSCNPNYEVGAWVAQVITSSGEKILKGIQRNTTHNRMELLAVLKAFEHINETKPNFDAIKVYTDSQYVAGIEKRIIKFTNSRFKTKSGNDIRNIDLVKELITYIEYFHPIFYKVKAHQKVSSERDRNREVDMLSRKLVREYIKKNKSK